MKIESDILKTAGVIALLVGVYGGVVFWPGQRQNEALADQVQDKQSQLQSLQQPDLAPLRSEIASLRAELRDNAVQLPIGGLHDRVLHHVSDTLMDQGVSEYETSYEDPALYKRFAATPITIEFNARFTQAYQVLREIETAGPPLRIEQMAIRGEPDDTQGLVEVELELSSFYMPTEREGGRR